MTHGNRAGRTEACVVAELAVLEEPDPEGGPVVVAAEVCVLQLLVLTSHVLPDGQQCIWLGQQTPLA